MSKTILSLSGELGVVLRGVSPALLEEIALPILRERGWTFERGGKPETPRQLMGRLGISHSTLERRLADPLCPDVLVDYCRPGPENRGLQKKRIRFIHSTQILDAFLVKGTRAERQQ